MLHITNYMTLIPHNIQRLPPIKSHSQLNRGKYQILNAPLPTLNYERTKTGFSLRPRQSMIIWDWMYLHKKVPPPLQIYTSKLTHLSTTTKNQGWKQKSWCWPHVIYVPPPTWYANTSLCAKFLPPISLNSLNPRKTNYYFQTGAHGIEYMKRNTADVNASTYET